MSLLAHTSDGVDDAGLHYREWTPATHISVLEFTCTDGSGGMHSIKVEFRVSRSEDEGLSRVSGETRVRAVEFTFAQLQMYNYIMTTPEMNRWIRNAFDASARATPGTHTCHVLIPTGGGFHNMNRGLHEGVPGVNGQRVRVYADAAARDQLRMYMTTLVPSVVPVYNLDRNGNGPISEASIAADPRRCARTSLGGRERALVVVGTHNGTEWLTMPMFASDPGIMMNSLKQLDIRSSSDADVPMQIYALTPAQCDTMIPMHMRDTVTRFVLVAPVV